MSTIEPGQHGRQRGRNIHRRETFRQILLPFLIGFLGLAIAVGLIAVQREGVWRIRAATIGDFLYMILCILPMLLCSLATYIIALIGIVTINKLHHRTQSPLERVETMANGLAKRVESLSTGLNARTTRWSARLEHILTFLDIFEPTQEGTSDDTGTATDRSD